MDARVRWFFVKLVPMISPLLRWVGPGLGLTTLLAALTATAQWPIGMQLSSVKDIPTPQAQMAQLRAWGVTELEGGWPRQMSAKEYRRLLNEHGLRLVGMGADFGLLRDSVALVAQRAKALGAEYVVCYWIPHGETFTLADADKAIAVFTKAGQALRKKGLTLCYHNHGYEFVKHGSRTRPDGTLFDYLAERLPADVTQFELDVIWAKNTREGALPQDPTALLKRYAGRFPLVHLKDRRPGTPSALINPALRPHQVALGQGDLGLSRFLQEARRSGVKHLFIEDESLKPLEQIPQSIAFLRQWERHKDEIRLLVRADDLGMAHAANRGIADAVRNGLARSVEVMAPTGWLAEGSETLRHLPTADVGVHLTLTSEWKTLRWRPLTAAPSLVDSTGHFFQTTWKGTSAMTSLLDHAPDFGEAERELRAQIERVRALLPQTSHLSVHMAFDRSHPRLRELVEKLSAESRLPLLEPSTAEPFPKFEGQDSPDPTVRERGFVAALRSLTPGTYLLVTHPAYDTDEMKPLGADVSANREADTTLLTSAAAKAVIAERGIRPIDYRTVFEESQHP